MKGNFLRKTIYDELKNYSFFKNVRGRGLRNSFEYNTTNNSLFGYFLKHEMLKKKIFIDSKWHRVCLPIALNINYLELEKNLDILIKTFKKVQNNWPKLSKQTVKFEKFF